MTSPGFYKERQIPPDFQGMEREYKVIGQLAAYLPDPALNKTVLHFF